jgi:uncharacterized protein (TIGR02147 family)
MKNDIYKYTNYKQYLRDNLRVQGRETKGLRLKLSNFIGCQPSYLSQVLNSKPQLNLEQAIKVNQFFTHDSTEAKYFMTLVEYARAGSRDLQNYFMQQLNEIKDARLNLKKRLKDTEEVPLEDQHKYYSAWFYSAIHVILSIEAYQDPQKIAERLNLPIELVVETIYFLEQVGLIQKSGHRYEVTKKRLHLGRESIFIQRHHINWRSQVLQSVEKNLSDDLHYSNTIAIAKSDFKKIKESFVNAIEEARNIIRPSKEEDVYTIALDVFRL